MPEGPDRKKMQEDAARRMREMQSRARLPIQEKAPEPEPAPEPKPQPPETPGLLETLLQDRERTLILALLLLLSGEDGNHELMFALMFLLM